MNKIRIIIHAHKQSAEIDLDSQFVGGIQQTGKDQYEVSTSGAISQIDGITGASIYEVIGRIIEALPNPTVYW